MLLYQRSAAFALLAASLLITLTACANTPTGKALEQSLSADPSLKDNPVTFGGAKNSPPAPAAAQLPADFPAEIPLYPNAKLQEVKPLTGEPEGSAGQTRWASPDSGTAVREFYQKQFQESNWETVSQPAGDGTGTLEVRRDNLRVKVSVEPKAAAGVTAFTIKYLRETAETAQPQPAPSPAASAQPSPETASPAPPTGTETPPASAGAGSLTDLNKAPAQLRQYLEDLAKLGVLTPSAAAKSKEPAAGTLFEPNKAITRRQFARWLLDANNKIYASQPARQIRPGLETAQPAFTDVPVKDPDFGVIQGLAEAGIIPSPLSGDSTTVQFRPDAPLTRETLALWKVPLDTRKSLPAASTDAVQQTWGFQDAAKIDPKALRAVLADYQNGDLANIRRSFGYTALLQPKKPVTRAEAASALWYFGFQGEGISAKDALQQ
ncbi:MAG: S-layer homology domain-containing protein [Oscillatoria princeps RMCB-10]|nr:S-layer homology domain-containing protein [Oscillatoria princeps RMCB-10]